MRAQSFVVCGQQNPQASQAVSAFSSRFLLCVPLVYALAALRIQGSMASFSARPFGLGLRTRLATGRASDSQPVCDSIDGV